MESNKEATVDLTHLFHSYGLKAPLIKVGDKHLADEIKNLVPSFELTKKKSDFILNILTAIPKRPECITSLKEISNACNLSTSTVRMYIEEFIDIGIVTKSFCTTDPTVYKRKGVLYELIMPELAFSTNERNTGNAIVERQQMKLEDVDLIDHKQLTDFAFCDLITSVLFGALRFNRKGSSNKILSNVLWGSERVLVETRSGRGEKIAQLFDLKYYIATITVLESIIKDRLLNNETITETYNIPLNSILTVLNKPKTGGHKNITRNALYRLSGTTFHIRNLPKWFLEKYNMTERSSLHLDIFNLRLEGESKEVSGSIILQLQFPPETVSQIVRSIDGDSDSIHELTKTFSKALSTSNNLIFAFNLWTSHYFASKGMAIIDWVELKDRTAPQLSLTDFKINFSKILLDNQCKATTISEHELDENGLQKEVLDESYTALFKSGVAINVTAILSGIRLSLADGEFVLLPEITPSSMLLRKFFT